MRKKLLSILLTFCMALTLLPTAAFAEEGTATTVKTAEQLTTAVANGGTVKLMENIIISTSLTITGTVTLDLNGHVLKYENNDANGSVIKVESGGHLTIMDSNTENLSHKFNKTNDLWTLDESSSTETVTGGVITGGTGTQDSNCYNGGGVYVAPGGKLTMEGGSIVGCSANGGAINKGGGVYIADDSTNSQFGEFTMNGGSIIGCTADCGGGVVVDPGCKFTMNSSAEIRSCTARNGGGVYINAGDSNLGEFTLNGGSILACKATVEDFQSSSGGGVYNSGKFIMESGKIQNCTSTTDESNGVYNGKDALFTMYVKTKEAFLAALADQNVTTIQLKESSITVDGTEPLTINRPITLGGSCTLNLWRPLTIVEGGALTLEDGTWVYPFSNVTVNGSLTVGENSGIIFEMANTSLKVSQGGTVTTQPAGEDTVAGLLSLGKDVELTVNGTLNNNGTLSVSDMENLKKAADIGGDLTLLNMTITEDYTLDMKGKQLSIDTSLAFDGGANLTVRNASRVDATSDTLTISGGSYYCPVYAGDSEYGITGGSFYGPVTVRYQGSSEGTTPTPIFGGMFCGGIQGWYEIKGGTFYNGSFQQGFSLPETTRIEVGKKIVTYKNGEDVYAMQVVSDRATAPDTPVKSGYTFAGWYTEAGEMFDFKKTNVTKNITLTAKWTRNSSSRTYYTIQATAGTGGAISPSGKVSVREGRNQVFTITPDQGYAVSDVKIDGESVGAVTSYSFENVRKAHTIAVSFAKAKTFVDVPAGSYYEDAVNWAVENGITQGTDDTHFSPDDVCTRAQMVTFLWRAAGSPKVENGKNPFTDVKADAYYYDAVLWAVEKGVTSGTSATTFSPDATVTRGQTVTFLYRNAGSPEVSGTMPFTDVEADAYYAKAVQWAVQQKITTGTSETTFSPMSDCTRGQIVTFLYRAK